MSSTECEDIEDSKKKDMTINEKPIWCEELVDDNEMRHQCFRKKCFREVYDYNARAIIKTRLPFIFPITNYYAIRVRGNGTQAYEAIVKSYYRWLTFSKLAMNLYDKYIAIATASAIFIYINFRRKIISFFIDNPSDGSSDKLYVIREVKFGYYTDEDDSNHLYLVATLESGDLQAWIIETDDTTNSIETKQTKISEAKHKNLCLIKFFWDSEEFLFI
ncbi:Protein of unknown function [Cotesia congregata]|uniref:Uncharacterized protein n=1 Tax=Cotesia congregata TaxID=51543 RepID=A0A8J2MKE8_COTCN|nr:Protein of unknown function [Cotesia congregata]